MTRASLISLLAASGGALAAACADDPTALPARHAPPAVAIGAATAADDAPASNPVVVWNAELLHLVRTPNAQPATVHSTRSFAMLHAAVYDAVNAIDRGHRPYLVRIDAMPDGSQDAAAAAAAHGVLVALYPAFASELDRLLAASLARLPADARRAEGVRAGEAVAASVVAARRGDGADATPPPFTFGTGSGQYRSTPPNFPAQPVFTHWAHVTPFVLARADRFRPPPPPRLSGEAYRLAVAEVRAFGGAGGTAGGTTASADEMLTGRFWNGPIQNYWNEIAQTAATERSLSTAESARLFVLLDVAIADGVIAFYDAKYAYAFWRPVTAIRAAGPDSTWLPLVGNSPADPSYPGAHAVVSAAAAAVLQSVLGGDRLDLRVTSEAMPGVTRSFARLSDAANEASRSRVFAGVHFSFDETQGARLGERIARLVVARVATPASGRR
ncbi:MAG: vanadium-dependent haloperoxidase [Gemmatirosa sp.]|nr:vanadium-dependent haloperoxidase [Gemmatirosa sp.]